ncbi:hypothetical protein NDU88_000731 [Pleurodeles waltl]|uniref:Uncharacterized protein n=1 Tax=Pleurodeles waltl TaxID=8319 RepID=A0AAV7SY47_PLEWA|nr:hypothetical protein NDU88_000731 [Pleurodeles waltl]
MRIPRKRKDTGSIAMELGPNQTTGSKQVPRKEYAYDLPGFIWSPERMIVAIAINVGSVEKFQPHGSTAIPQCFSDDGSIPLANNNPTQYAVQHGQLCSASATNTTKLYKHKDSKAYASRVPWLIRQTISPRRMTAALFQRFKAVGHHTRPLPVSHQSALVIHVLCWVAWWQGESKYQVGGLAAGRRCPPSSPYRPDQSGRRIMHGTSLTLYGVRCGMPGNVGD